MAKQKSEFRIVGTVSTSRGVYRAGNEAEAAEVLTAEEVASLRERGVLVDGDAPARAATPLTAGGGSRARALEPDDPAVGGTGDAAPATVRTMGEPVNGTAGTIDDGESPAAESEGTTTTSRAARGSRKSATKKGR